MTIFVWIGLFSTLASNVYVLKNILPINVSDNFKCFAVLILSVILGFVKFDIFVNYIYLLIGFIGVFLVFLTLKHNVFKYLNAILKAELGMLITMVTSTSIAQ
jgi:hypothetical protein